MSLTNNPIFAKIKKQFETDKNKRTEDSEMSVKLLIFDKDGVIFDTEPGKTKSYWLALRELAKIAGLKEVPDESLDPIHHFWDEADYCVWHTKYLTGKSRQEAVSGNFDRIGKMIDQVMAEQSAAVGEALAGGGKEVKKELVNPKLLSDNQRIFSALRLNLYNDIPLCERARPIKPTIGLMKMAIRAGNRIALITESEYERTVREMEQLIPLGLNLLCFRVAACKDGIFVAGQKTAEGGEKQEMYKRIMSLAACEPQECLVVEDTDKGQAAALAAGLTCLMVSFPGAS